uniref:Uncharacterized protein n=1 Tax=Arion vulgaris TaxID=1028688 RepID=A0A0B6Z3S7_9EUPU
MLTSPLSIWDKQWVGEPRDILQRKKTVQQQLKDHTENGSSLMGQNGHQIKFT